MEPGVDVAQQIAELRGLSVPALVARYEALFGKPPRVKNREWLWKRCAWKLQEQAFGGLSGAAKARLEELIAEIKLPAAEDRRTVRGTLKRSPRSGDPAVGSTITRVWRDTEIRVRVLETGFEWNGEIYNSLSATARAITGSHWNPRLFFKLVGRKRPR